MVTVPADCSASCPELLEDARRAGALITAGGDTRTASVVAALDALKDAQVPVDYVLIHDCARAFTPPQVYHRVLEGLGSASPQGCCACGDSCVAGGGYGEDRGFCWFGDGYSFACADACGADSSGF